MSVYCDGRCLVYERWRFGQRGAERWRWGSTLVQRHCWTKKASPSLLTLLMYIEHVGSVESLGGPELLWVSMSPRHGFVAKRRASIRCSLPWFDSNLDVAVYEILSRLFLEVNRLTITKYEGLWDCIKTSPGLHFLINGRSPHANISSCSISYSMNAVNAQIFLPSSSCADMHHSVHAISWK